MNLASVVIFCPTDTWGGVEKNVLLRSEHLGVRGHKVIVVLLKNTFRARFEHFKNVSVFEITSRGGDLNLFVVYNYWRLLKRTRPEAVFSALKKDWWLVSIAANLAKVPNTILYLGIKRNIRAGIKYRTVFKTLKAKILVNSDSLKKDLLERNAYFNEGNVFRIYNGFEIPDMGLETRDLKSTLNLSKNSFIIGCAGRFSHQKGFDLLPEIAAALPENFHFAHAGGGPLEEEIKLLVKNSPVSNRIHFLGYLKNMSPFFTGIDAFLLCSRFEGMANVLNEAMSYGKPMVSSRVEGTEELLGHGKYGVIVEIEDITAMAEALKKIANKSIVFDAVILQNRIKNDFSMAQMINKTEQLFFETP